jgi:transposase
MARTEPELTDAQWAALEPLLAPQRPPTGRPNNDHRQVVEAMVWLARTGSPWRDLPGEYGSWKTVASRLLPLAPARHLRPTVGRGAPPRRCPWAAGLAVPLRGRQCGPRPPARRRRPPPARPGGPEKGIVHPPAEALGTSRGGLSTKLHLRTDGHGRPLVLLATPGQRHEVTQLEALLDGGVVKRTRPDGRPGRVGRANAPPSWSATRATRFRVPGGCCAVAGSAR